MKKIACFSPALTLVAALWFQPSVFATAANRLHKHPSGKGDFANKERFFDSSVKGLPEAKVTETVIVKTGETFVMTASPVKQKINGKWTRRLAYNGMIPGPLLRAAAGARLTVILKNRLSIETTLHPHGLRVRPEYDGVPGIGQPPIPPGGEYRYDLEFRDSGIYWYHPHIRDEYTVDSGLYGMIIVDPLTHESLAIATQEVPLILDDIGRSKADQRYSEGKVTHTLMGRFGAEPYINGGAEIHLKAKVGDRIRFFLLNAANTRTFRFALADTSLVLVSGENGPLEREENIDAVTMGPGERYIVDAIMLKPGTVDILNAKPHSPWRLGDINIAAGPGHKSSDKEVNRSPAADVFTEVRKKLGAKPDYSLRMTVAMDHGKLPMVGMQHSNGAKAHSGSESDDKTLYYKGRTSGVEWDDEMPAVNQKSDDTSVTWKLVDTVSGLENMNINWLLKNGAYYKIRMENDRKSMHPMQHPIHFHGNRFVVTHINGMATDNYFWKDTVLVGTGDVVDIVLEASNPGKWMAHCHILEHVGANMMMGFEVRN